VTVNPARWLLEYTAAAAAAVFAVPPPTGRQHPLDVAVTPEMVLRRAAQWRVVTVIAAVVLIAGVLAGGRLVPALAAGTLLLAVGERGECLGWISGYTYRDQDPHTTTGTVLADLGAITAELLDEADLIETWTSDQAAFIREAGRRGLTVAQYEDRIEAAITYVESGDYAQDVWERHAGLYDDLPTDTEHADDHSRIAGGTR
jgi:hypothetical protein